MIDQSCLSNKFFWLDLFNRLDNSKHKNENWNWVSEIGVRENQYFNAGLIHTNIIWDLKNGCWVYYWNTYLIEEQIFIENLNILLSFFPMIL